MLRHLPNLLSALRLVSAPLAAWAMLSGHDTAALAVFGFAGFSDLADGFIARRWGFSSRFGAWLDPAADKLLMLLCFVALMRMGYAPLWLVLLVLARDFAIALGVGLAWALALPVRIAPLMVGKAAMLVQVAYVGGWLLLLAFDWDAPRLMRAGAYTVAVFACLSAAAYAGVLLRALIFGSRTA
jgi:cardiolipin synthase